MPAKLDTAQLSGSCKVSPTNSLPKTLSSEFGSLFGPGLGFAKGFVHRIKTRLDVLPVTSKIRRLALTLRPQRQKASPMLQNLQSLKVLDVHGGQTEVEFKTNCKLQTLSWEHILITFGGRFRKASQSKCRTH
ncbi:hypothetical protein MTO96_006303 [Rhipicephalus appendiculatus]